MNRFVDKLELLCCCVCKGSKSAGKLGTLTTVLICLLLFAQMTITHEDWRIVLAIEAGVVVTFILMWLAMLLCLVHRKATIFSARMLRHLANGACTYDDALEFICPSPWDHIVVGKCVKGEFRETPNNKYTPGKSSIQVHMWNVSSQYTLIFALLNPTLVNMLFVRKLPWLIMMICAATVFVSSAIYMHQHVKSMVVKRKWMRSMATAHAPRRIVHRDASGQEEGSSNDMVAEPTPSGNMTVLDSQSAFAESPPRRQTSLSRHVHTPVT